MDQNQANPSDPTSCYHRPSADQVITDRLARKLAKAANKNKSRSRELPPFPKGSDCADMPADLLDPYALMRDANLSSPEGAEIKWCELTIRPDAVDDDLNMKEGVLELPSKFMEDYGLIHNKEATLVVAGRVTAAIRIRVGHRVVPYAHPNTIAKLFMKTTKFMAPSTKGGRFEIVP